MESRDVTARIYSCLARISFMLLVAVPTYAQNSQDIIRAEPYFDGTVCTRLLNLKEGETFESVLVDHIKTVPQAYQLLFDYGLILNGQHELATQRLFAESAGMSVTEF